MLRSFVAWLDGYLDGEEPSAIVKAVVGLLGFAALLGALLGDTAIRAGAIVAVLLVLLAVMLLLLADRRRLRQEIKSNRRLVTRYCDIITDRSRPVVRVRSWQQVAVIEPNGDTREVITVHGVVQRKMHFMPLRFGSGWDQPERHRRGVRVKVRSLRVSGDRGTSWVVTSSWLPDGRLDLISHLHSPVAGDTEIHLEMEWFWPAKCAPLVRNREPDEFAFRFSNPVESVSYTVILPRRLDAYYDPIGFGPNDTAFSITPGRSQEGRNQFVLTARNLPLKRRIGMRLELK
jgi:hypothetical protein